MFGSKKNVIAPMSGLCIEITKCTDPVFSEKILGDGVAIEPTNGDVFSPVDGEIVQTVDTKHAMGIKSEDGAELLIHCGMDTVSLNGEGFENFVSLGDKVKIGQKIISMDLDFIKEKGLSTITPVVVTNYQEIKNLKFEYGDVTACETVIMKHK